VLETRQWLVLIVIASDSTLEVSLAADARPLQPSLLAQTPVEVLEFVKAGLVDSRRGDELLVEVRERDHAPALYSAPTSDAAVSWLASRLVEMWQPSRARSASGPHRVTEAVPAAAMEADPKSEAG
jgi:hypothetical protein